MRICSVPIEGFITMSGLPGNDPQSRYPTRIEGSWELLVLTPDPSAGRHISQPIIAILLHVCPPIESNLGRK